ncbi:ABC transporter ATP-binding protein [Catellatospora tritici]|uniref:ABC transporter ATP-binding protein n=1 Tax=Catellatospora tritici TaxID=2851566 RepID=UPI001C2D0E3B|nr:ABC transporter ATP-binding protein [Catellatospora tritici]MBV1856496.1 ABC transporter ATP-binding protein/permease [Catellatospora tritici]
MKTLRAAADLLSMAWRMDRAKLLRAMLLLGAGFVATPLVAVGLRELTDALLAGQTTQATVVGVLLAALLVLELMGQHFAHMSYFELGELAQNHLHHRLITAANAKVPLARQEQPDYHDDLQVAQSQTWKISNALESTLRFGGLVVQLAIGTALLVTLNPILVLMPCLAIFLVVAGARAQRLLDAAQQSAAEHTRRSQHFLRLATTSETLLELRLLGMHDDVLARHAAAWDGATSRLWRGQLRAALTRGAGQLAFSVGYAASLLLVFQQLATGTATIGDFVLVLALAVQTTLQITAAVSLLSVLQQTGMTLKRIDRLAEPQQTEPRPPASAPPGPESGIVVRDVAYRYPGAERPVLSDIELDLAPGTIVAIVGENGAGKSTLVKLLCGLYQPTAGRIWFGGREVDAGTPGDGTVAALFQDFARIELALRESVGVGACEGPQPAPDAAVRQSLARADLAELPDGLSDGLDSILGSRYARGAELSGGQWQRIALARTLVRDRPSLLVLDEPAAALDPMAEHSLFERFAAAARAQDAHGAVTVYVSHRFSTVRMADLIVVVEDGRVAATGTHDQLMAAGGTYAELYQLQARAYAVS